LTVPDTVTLVPFVPIEIGPFWPVGSSGRAKSHGLAERRASRNVGEPWYSATFAEKNVLVKLAAFDGMVNPTTRTSFARNEPP